jgi:glycosyltransferase involved in cell wall biosynthesis
MHNLEEPTILIINHRTADLIARSVESLLSFYPYANILLIDNGSNDKSSEYIRNLDRKHDQISALFNRHNRFHGPALDQGLKHCQTALVLTLDSDTEVIRGGLLEEMASCFIQPRVYAVGKLVHMDWFGYELGSNKPFSTAYIHPACMMIRRETYLTLKPFFHHGSPAIRNMRHATRSGQILVDFPIDDYINHLGRGTCSRYGYGLGLRHTFEYLLHHLFIRLYA